MTIILITYGGPAPVVACFLLDFLPRLRVCSAPTVTSAKEVRPTKGGGRTVRCIVVGGDERLRSRVAHGRQQPEMHGLQAPHVARLVRLVDEPLRTNSQGPQQVLPIRRSSPAALANPRHACTSAQTAPSPDQTCAHCHAKKREATHS